MKARVEIGGKLAVVTGGSEGIGLAIGLQLARHGARVVLLARRQSVLQQAAHEFARQGLQVTIQACDLSDTDDCRRAFQQLQKTRGTIDILVNNAGSGTFGPLVIHDEAQLRAGLMVPAQASIQASYHVLPGMLESGYGCIVNIVTPAAYFPLPWMAPYTASRWALMGFSQSLYHEVKTQGVHVATICPGKVETRYLENNAADIRWWPRMAQWFPTSSPQAVADRVIRAVQLEKREQIFPWSILCLVRLYGVFPGTCIRLLEWCRLFQPVNDRAQPARAASVRNWEESIDLDASCVVHAHSAQDIQRIVLDTARYRSPLRTAGSRHSTTHCGVADGGTVLVTRLMDRVLDINTENLTVTVQAGALYVDVARVLEQRGLQFYVNVEIGNLTMGSAACTGTKDASFAGEMGQVCSYLSAAKLVTGNGDILEVDETQAELLQALRSSYGLLGVIFEVTFRIKPLRAMAVYHRNYTLDEFELALPELCARGESIMYYLFPFSDSLTVEFRHYDESRAPSGRLTWFVRNLVWKTLAPAISALATRWISHARLRFMLLDGFYRLLQIILRSAIKSNKTFAGDQIIRYPQRKGIAKYTFSIWAFPENSIVSTMRAYYRFCQEYYQRTGYRCDILNVGYRIAQDRNPLLSYSYHGNVMTLDPVCTANEPGWDDFLQAYNAFCSQNCGIPLFNQTKWLTPAQVDRAFGDRIDELNHYRQLLDAENRFTNDYFRSLFDRDTTTKRVPGPNVVAEPGSVN